MAQGFIIAGERSGVGKTTITLAVVKTLINRVLMYSALRSGLISLIRAIMLRSPDALRAILTAG